MIKSMFHKCLFFGLKLCKFGHLFLESKRRITFENESKCSNKERNVAKCY